MSIFRRRSRGSFQPICSEHRLPAYYLGKHPAKGKVGLTVIQGPVAALYNQFRETTAKRVLLEVKNEGLWVKHTSEAAGGKLARRHTVGKGSNLGNRSNSSFTIATEDISFGAVDSNQRKVFAIIVRKTEPEDDFPWECHAFLCNTHPDAKELTLNLVASFQKLAQSKDVGGNAPSPNTMHVFTESLSPKNPRGDAGTNNVTTLKITFNVEQIDTSEPSEYNRNRHISKILSQKETSPYKDNSKPGEAKQNSVRLSGSSDKENESSDSDILDEPAVKPRTSVVAVNTGLTQLTRVQEDGSDEDTQMAIANEVPDQAVTDTAQKTSSPKPTRTKPKPRKKKTVRFTAEINYIE